MKLSRFLLGGLLSLVSVSAFAQTATQFQPGQSIPALGINNAFAHKQDYNPNAPQITLTQDIYANIPPTPTSGAIFYDQTYSRFFVGNGVTWNLVGNIIVGAGSSRPTTAAPNTIFVASDNSNAQSIYYGGAWTNLGGAGGGGSNAFVISGDASATLGTGGPTVTLTFNTSVNSNVGTCSPDGAHIANPTFNNKGLATGCSSVPISITAANISSGLSPLALATAMTTFGAHNLFGVDSAGNPIATVTQGNGNKVQLATGSYVAGHGMMYDSNGNAIDTGYAAPILLAGATASRPAAATANNGWRYWDTTTNFVYLSNGSTWVLQTNILFGPIASLPGAAIAGRCYVGTDNNSFNCDTGSAWVTIAGTGGSGSLTPVGTPGTYYKVVTNTYGQVSSGSAALVEADISVALGANFTDAAKTWSFANIPTYSGTAQNCNTTPGNTFATTTYVDSCFVSQPSGNIIYQQVVSDISVAQVPPAGTFGIAFSQSNDQWYAYAPNPNAETLALAQSSGASTITLSGINLGLTTGTSSLVTGTGIASGTYVTSLTVSGSNTIVGLSANTTATAAIGASVTVTITSWTLQQTLASSLVGTLPSTIFPQATTAGNSGVASYDPNYYNINNHVVTCSNACVTLGPNFVYSGGNLLGQVTATTSIAQAAAGYRLTFAGNPGLAPGMVFASGSLLVPVGDAVAGVSQDTSTGTTITYVDLAQPTTGAGVAGGTALVFNNLSDQIIDYNALPQILAANNGNNLDYTSFGDSRATQGGLYSLNGPPGASPTYIWAQWGSPSVMTWANAFLGGRLNGDMQFGYIMPTENQILKYIVIDGGAGYTSTPTVTASTTCAGSTPGAATIQNGVLTAVALGTPASCTFPPANLVISGGGATRQATVQTVAGQGGTFATNGINSNDMVGRLNDVLASKASIIDFWCCTNDPSAGITLATSKANWLYMVQRMLVYGKTVIAHTDLPRSIITAGTLATQQFLSEHDVYKREVSRNQLAITGVQSKLILLDQSPVVADATSATGEALPKALKDGLHWSAWSAEAEGWELAGILANALGLPQGMSFVNTFSSTQVDAFDINNNPHGILGTSLYSPFFLTPGGTVGPCTGTAGVGIVASVTSVPSAVTGATTSCALSLAARTDYYSGLSQHIVVANTPASATSTAAQTSGNNTKLTISASACSTITGLAVGAIFHGGTLPSVGAPGNIQGGGTVTALSGTAPCVVTLSQPTSALDASGTSYTWGPATRWYRWQVGGSQTAWGYNSATATSSAVQPAANQIVLASLPTSFVVGVGMTGGSIANTLPPSVVLDIAGTGPYTITLDRPTVAGNDASATVYNWADRVKCRALLTFAQLTGVNHLDFRFSQIEPSTFTPAFATRALSEWGGSLNIGDYLPDSSDGLRTLATRPFVMETYPVSAPSSTGTMAFGLQIGVDGSATSGFTADWTNVECRKVSSRTTN